MGLLFFQMTCFPDFAECLGTTGQKFKSWQSSSRFDESYSPDLSSNVTFAALNIVPNAAKHNHVFASSGTIQIPVRCSTWRALVYLHIPM